MSLSNELLYCTDLRDSLPIPASATAALPARFHQHQQCSVQTDANLSLTEVSVLKRQVLASVADPLACAESAICSSDPLISSLITRRSGAQRNPALSRGPCVFTCGKLTKAELEKKKKIKFFVNLSSVFLSVQSSLQEIPFPTKTTADINDSIF